MIARMRRASGHQIRLDALGQAVDAVVQHIADRDGRNAICPPSSTASGVPHYSGDEGMNDLRSNCMFKNGTFWDILGHCGTFGTFGLERGVFGFQ